MSYAWPLSCSDTHTKAFRGIERDIAAGRYACLEVLHHVGGDEVRIRGVPCVLCERKEGRVPICFVCIVECEPPLSASSEHHHKYAEDETLNNEIRTCRSCSSASRQSCHCQRCRSCRSKFVRCLLQCSSMFGSHSEDLVARALCKSWQAPDCSLGLRMWCQHRRNSPSRRYTYLTSSRYSRCG